MVGVWPFWVFLGPDNTHNNLKIRIPLTFSYFHTKVKIGLNFSNRSVRKLRLILILRCLVGWAQAVMCRHVFLYN